MENGEVKETQAEYIKRIDDSIDGTKELEIKKKGRYR